MDHLPLFTHEIEVLRKHMRTNRDLDRRPLFIFPCGGDEGKYVSRKRFREYVAAGRSGNLHDVYCLTAEDIAKSKALKGLNLLQQEAILADISDWIIIFAESPGSFCELGAFSALPHAAAVTSVAIDRRYASDHSFVNDGPVKELRDSKSVLSKAFSIPHDNPFADARFARFVFDIRSHVKASERVGLGRQRKTINSKDEEMVRIGPLVHELLDLLQILGPSTDEELRTCYCEVKQYDPAKLEKVSSVVLTRDMQVGDMANVSYESVLAMMLATGLVKRNSEDRLQSRVHLSSFFMFKETSDRDFADACASIKLRKVRGKVVKGVYKRYAL